MYIPSSKLNQYYIQICDDNCRITVIWLRMTNAANENLLTSRTKHHFFELQYVLNGTIHFRLSEQDILLSAGDFILVTPELFHEITSYTPDTKKIVFGFEAEFFDEQIQKRFLSQQYDPRRETSHLRRLAELLVSLPEDREQITDDTNLHFIDIQLQCITEAFVFAILSIIMPIVTDESKYASSKKRFYKQETVDKILQYIRSNTENYFETVDTIAQHFHISKRHLDRICVDVTGKTARELLDEERLRYIRELLATTSYTLHEIAFLSGFTNEQSLIRFFRQREGYTPGQYRKYILK